MKFYFLLQYRRIYRFIEEAGIPPFAGFGAAALLFTLFSFAVFLRIPYPEHVYALLSLLPSIYLADSRRNGFLSNTFSKPGYRQVRLLENAVATLPFSIFLLLQGHFLHAPAILPAAMALSFFQFRSVGSFALPTPFRRWPHEFIVGFRKSWWAFCLLYIPLYQGIAVDNFNLGIFALAGTFLACIGFYSKPEPKFYIWTHALSAKAFLFRKAKIALGLGFALSFPIFLSLLIAFPAMAWIILLFEIWGLLVLLVGLFGKYAYYPSEVNIVQALALGACLIVPPALLAILPAFYNKSLKQLKPLLR